MKIKTTLPLLLLGFATVGSDTFGMSCGYKVTNGVDIATNLAQGTSVGVQIQCSESNPAIVDPQFKFSWAPPFEPSFGDSGASIVYGSTPNLVSTGVLEVTCCDPALDPLCGSGGGGTCDPADPSCTGRHKNDSPKRCRPDDPNCGKNGTMAFFDPKTFRDFRIYKKFKKILVAKSKRDTGDLVCTQVDVKIFDGIPVISTPPCGDNCVAPPTQNPTGTGDNGPDHQCGGTSGGELPKPRSASNFRSCGLPVNVATGAMWHQFTDFSIPGRTPDTEISFVRTYTSSPAQQPGPLGIRWQHNYQTHIERSSVPGSQDLNWVDENGNADLFKRQSDGSFNAPPGDLEVLTPFSDHFELKKTNGTVYFYYGFNASNGGMIYKITDVHGETVSFSYDDSGNLTSVSSPFAGVVNITHNGVRLITSITRERDNLTYNYGYDSFNRLSSVTDFAGRTYTYSYIDDKPGLATAGLLSSFTDPIGRVTSFTYDDQGRANNQYEPGGGKWNYLYGDHQTSVTAPNGGVTKYFFDANLREIEEVAPNSAINYKSWTDSAAISRQRSEYGGTTMWTYDANGNATSYRRPEDKSPKQVTYDLKFNVATLIQPSVGAATQKVLDPNTGDVLQEVRAGLTLSHTYDKFGNVLSTSNGRATYADQRDANGFLTHLFDLHNPQTLTYDTRGRVTSRSYLSGRVITYTYNDDDQVLVTADSAGPTTSNTYDAMKRRTLGARSILAA
jgi:YD repeat-containing protein